MNILKVKKMIKFVRQDEIDVMNRVEIQISDQSSLDEVLEAMTSFLRACGYTIEYNKVLDLVNVANDWNEKDE